MITLSDLSIIVPVRPGESAWIELIKDLKLLPLSTEILFVGPRLPPDAPTVLTGAFTNGRKVRWIDAPLGRAVQMNAGARAAIGRFVWFLHADTRFNDGALVALEASIRSEPGSLHYFDLEYAPDGPKWMALNQAGARFRSHVLGMPFGDQGFCLDRDLFLALGGFPEDARVGEDHLFVWTARQKGVRLRCTEASLTTSARKYATDGWLATTARHLQITAQQALPESIKLGKARVMKGLR